MKSLSGKRVLVTRTREQASELSKKIAELGGEPVEFPVIALQEPSDPQKLRNLDEAIVHLDQFDWIVFTSVNGVRFFFRRMERQGTGPICPQGVRIAAVGPKTQAALERYGWPVHLVPRTYDAEHLLEALLPKLTRGEHIFLPRADIGRKVLPDTLRAAGMHVYEADVYENRLCDDGADEIVDLLRRKAIDAVTFTSSSTVHHLMQILQRYETDPLRLLEGVVAACIGPLTADAARAHGLTAGVIPDEATVEALSIALAEAIGMTQ